jgi:competence ComEA-like helix-hairpin-helix protein
MMPKQASVLVGVLWCVALLSLVVVSALHSSSLGLRIGHHYGDSIQAHYLALAGVERAKALLYHEAAQRRQGQVNHSGQLYEAPSLFREVPLGRGSFSVFRQDHRGATPRIAYGILDEERRLNLNTASERELANLPLMPPEAVPAIVDWRDSDDQVTPNGAEIDYYASLSQPYLPRNGAFQTAGELLMVRGVPRQLVLGEDANQNGLLDPEENDGDLSLPPDNQDGVLTPGWTSWLTVHSSVENVSASGEARVNIQTADESSLTTVPGISQPIAQAIVAARGNQEFQSLADLLEVRTPAPARPGQPQPTPQVPELGSSPVVRPNVAGPSGRPRPNANSSGPPLIDETLLKDIADFLTVSDETTEQGLVNVNTASVEVLACLPGLDRESARAIVAQRESAGFFPNIAALLDVTGLTREAFQNLAPRITTRSETFRIFSEGTVPSSGARRRMEVIVHLGANGIDTLAYRENL